MKGKLPEARYRIVWILRGTSLLGTLRVPDVEWTTREEAEALVRALRLVFKGIKYSVQREGLVRRIIRMFKEDQP